MRTTLSSNLAQILVCLGIGTAILAFFWTTGSPENGWLGFVIAGLIVWPTTRNRCSIRSRGRARQ